MSSGRRRALRLRVGSLDVATLPTPPALAIVADDGDGAVSLSASAVRMGSHCDDSWVFVGEVLDGSVSRDITANVVYHGVQRHGDKAYVHLTGTVETPADRRRWRRRAEFALAVDLLFGAPAVEARSVSDGTSRSDRPVSSTQPLSAAPMPARAAHAAAAARPETCSLR
jgi:hypothetical protein